MDPREFGLSALKLDSRADEGARKVECMRLQAKDRWFLAGLLLTMSCPAAFSQQAASSAGKASPSAPGSVSPTELIQFLNQTISWYHQVTIQQEIATEPEEQVTFYDNRQIANQVVRLAFDFARAQADAIAEQPGTKQAGNADAGLPQYEILRQMQAKLDQQHQDTQAELDGDEKKLATAAGAARRKLESEISELRGELALTDARRDALRGIAQFVSSSASTGKGAAGLRAQIEALAATVPNATSNEAQSSKQQSSSVTPYAAPNAPDLSGIWDLTTNIVALSSKKRAINSLIRVTNALSASSKQLRGPFVAQLKALSARGDQLAAQADTANQSILDQERQQLDSLAAQFRHISAAVIPLSKQSVLLNLYERNLTNWRDVIDARYKSDLRSLGVRLGFLAVLLAVLFGLAELWRRAVIRYVQEPRRRHQFLLMRKFALWFVIALIIAITLAGRLGSFATFAGLLTAGVALALSNVIVSIVSYFLLIGKYGIRVGDRVQAGGTTGEVIDVGLVRFHMMEMDKGGTPTGRVVAFSNSIVFQPTAGLFKQIPGTSFTWHEVSTKVPREADFALVRKKLLEAAENLLREYQDDIARQYRLMEKTGILVSEKALRPRVDLRLSSSSVEVTIRYPVDMQHAAEIDARMSRELLATLEGETELSGAETPQVQVKTDVPVGGAR
jgi:small-conductance mechanosensitive channel